MSAVTNLLSHDASCGAAAAVLEEDKLQRKCWRRISGRCSVGGGYAAAAVLEEDERRLQLLEEDKRRLQLLEEDNPQL